MELKPGEKYLKARIDVGGIILEFVAFPNKESTMQNKQPEFKGKNIGIWVNEKQGQPTRIKL